MLRTLYSGIPKQFTYKMQQDDFLMNTASKVGGNISVSQTPNFTTRVYLPPFEEWEQRTGVSFGIRAGCLTTKTVGGGGLFGLGTSTESEEYWPGMFIQYHCVADGKTDHNHAQIIVRSGPSGHDIFGPKIEQPGWWTFGMSFTPDGAVHYFAKPGVDNLTEQDRLTSQFPYGYRAKWFETVFFNVANMDDGKTWSTPWVVDDVSLYLASGTDQIYMREEAELLDVAKYFDGGVFGALDDYKKFSKKILIEKIIRESDFEGSEFVGFGDGFVEIENVKEVGGVAVGVASDEPECLKVDPVKRERLIGVGADWIVPNFTAHDELMSALFPTQ